MTTYLRYKFWLLEEERSGLSLGKSLRTRLSRWQSLRLTREYAETPISHTYSLCIERTISILLQRWYTSQKEWQEIKRLQFPYQEEIEISTPTKQGIGW